MSGKLIATRVDRTEGHDDSLFESKEIAQLVITARSLFDTDHVKAKRCIERALELLRGNEPLGAAPFVPALMPGGLCAWQVKQLKAYIEANLGGKIPIPKLAALTQQSTGHFFRTFRASFGESPLAYIRRQRVLRAEQLIRGSGTPLARIAADCGLCDQAHLSRIFRRTLGVSPSTWRRQAALEPQQVDPAPDSQRAGAAASVRIAPSSAGACLSLKWAGTPAHDKSDQRPRA